MKKFVVLVLPIAVAGCSDAEINQAAALTTGFLEAYASPELSGPDTSDYTLGQNSYTPPYTTNSSGAIDVGGGTGTGQSGCGRLYNCVDTPAIESGWSPSG